MINYHSVMIIDNIFASDFIFERRKNTVLIIILLIMIIILTSTTVS